jgi:hypothetical protein
MTTNPSGQIKRLPYGHLLLLVAFFVAIGFRGASFNQPEDQLIADIRTFSFLLAVPTITGAISGTLIAQKSFFLQLRKSMRLLAFCLTGLITSFASLSISLIGHYPDQEPIVFF